MTEHDPKSPASRPSSLSERVRERLYSVGETLQAGGTEILGLRGARFLWKRLGFTGMVWVVIVVGVPVSDYSLLRWAAYRAIPRTIGSMGVEFTAEEWSLRPLTLTAVARNVQIREPHETVPIFTAAEITFKGSVLTFLKGLPDMLTFHRFGGDQPFNDITVNHAQLRLVRSLTGHLNWADLMHAVPEARRREAASGVYQINRIDFMDVRVTYVEHIPGQSSDGVIQTTEVTVNIDQIEGGIWELVRPASVGDRPTRIALRGRSADGIIRIEGLAAVFPPEGAASNSSATGDVQMAQASTPMSQSNGGVPYFDLTVYLENVGAAAYGRMVPVTTVVPIGGSIGGTITLRRTAASDVRCEGYFIMKDVRFGPNPHVFTKPEHLAVVKRSLSTESHSGPYNVCEGPGVDDALPRSDQPAASILLARFNEQGTESAIPEVRALVERDEPALSGEPVQSNVDQLTHALADKIGMPLVRATGTGVKSVGSGLKKLFGEAHKKLP